MSYCYSFTMANKLTPENEQIVADLVASNDVLIKDICARFGITRVTVHRIAARHGVRRPLGRRPRNLSKDEVAEIIRLAADGVSQAKIGEQFRLSQSRISGILRFHGIYTSKGRHQGYGENHHAWKGGVHTSPQGYVWQSVLYDDPFACMRNSTGYVLQHRLVMARHLGRPLTKDENVHHINGVRDDNRIENLELWTRPQPKGVRSAERHHCATCTCDTIDGRDAGDRFPE